MDLQKSKEYRTQSLKTYVRPLKANRSHIRVKNSCKDIGSLKRKDLLSSGIKGSERREAELENEFSRLN